jgi:hypothetical protein
MERIRIVPPMTTVDFGYYIAVNPKLPWTLKPRVVWGPVFYGSSIVDGFVAKENKHIRLELEVFRMIYCVSNC